MPSSRLHMLTYSLTATGFPSDDCFISGCHCSSHDVTSLLCYFVSLYTKTITTTPLPPPYMRRPPNKTSCICTKAEENHRDTKGKISLREEKTERGKKAFKEKITNRATVAIFGYLDLSNFKENPG